jgi:GntR family transcriptional repressor for pyruvate dehydrogenase complex
VETNMTGIAAADFGQSLGTLESSSVVTEVAERLMAAFTDGRVSPGERLPSERSLAASLSVGRSAVREALAALEILGIVIVRPGSGTYLRGGASELLPRTLSWGLMLGEPRTRELTELRSGLEIQAAELAAQRIDDAALARLAGYVEGMNASTQDFEAFKEADAHFHREIALASGNTVLEDLLQSIRSLLRIWVDRGLRDEAHAAQAAAEHTQIYHALAKHDPASARAVMESHMETASQRLLADFDPQ